MKQGITTVRFSMVRCCKAPTLQRFTLELRTPGPLERILTRRASEGSAPEPLLARRVSLSVGRLPSQRKPLLNHPHLAAASSVA
jgi:hypothetical protein